MTVVLMRMYAFYLNTHPCTNPLAFRFPLSAADGSIAANQLWLFKHLPDSIVLSEGILCPLRNIVLFACPR